jgi:hypothetical protein
MRNEPGIVAGVAVAIVLVWCGFGLAEEPNADLANAVITKMKPQQRMLELPVRVVDLSGKPVANAKVIPWALRSSQGHGPWSKEDERAKVGPTDVLTDGAGNAAVPYPYYRDLEEGIRTIAVSLQVDHPQFAYTGDLHIDVPLETDGPQMIELAAGIPLEIHPLLDGKPADLEDLFAMWSDGRSWQSGAAPEKRADGVLCIPAMPPGANSVLLVKLDGDRATHFSRITDVQLTSGKPKQIDVELRPSVRIEGALSGNVPRPVRQGRVKLWSLAPMAQAWDRVSWFTWAAIKPDGTFTIDGWPADEPMQLIALCEGFIAINGRPPESVKNARDPDPYNRPQMFDPDPGKHIEVAMRPLVSCVSTAVDEDDKPVAGVTVVSWPNVGWWHGGSQIYGYPLARSERLLRIRKYFDALEDAFPNPFEAQTDAEGKATLELPTGDLGLAVTSDVYELPVFLGRRDVRVTLSDGETAEVVLRLQPRGTERQGEWDKLAGVVFGCSTREGRRICALPGVQKKMDEFTRRFREAKNQRDPQLLAEAYTAVADAFVGVGDHVEAAKWRSKAAEQAAKAAEPSPAQSSIVE